MAKKICSGSDRRDFVRLNYVAPVACKVCKRKTLSKIMEGYTANISESGVLCSISEKVKKNDILWLSFDRTTLNICEELEKRALIYQSGVIGKVVRIIPAGSDNYSVGIKFVTRQEKNLTNIFPKIHFLSAQDK